MRKIRNIPATAIRPGDMVHPCYGRTLAGRVIGEPEITAEFVYFPVLVNGQTMEWSYGRRDSVDVTTTQEMLHIVCGERPSVPDLFCEVA